MYGIFTYIGVVWGVNVGIYGIHGVSGFGQAGTGQRNPAHGRRNPDPFCRERETYQDRHQEEVSINRFLEVHGCPNTACWKVLVCIQAVFYTTRSFKGVLSMEGTHYPLTGWHSAFCDPW